MERFRTRVPGAAEFRSLLWCLSVRPRAFRFDPFCRGSPSPAAENERLEADNAKVSILVVVDHRPRLLPGSRPGGDLRVSILVVVDHRPRLWVRLCRHFIAS